MRGDRASISTASPRGRVCMQLHSMTSTRLDAPSTKSSARWPSKSLGFGPLEYLQHSGICMLCVYHRLVPEVHAQLHAEQQGQHIADCRQPLTGEPARLLLRSRSQPSSGRSPASSSLRTPPALMPATASSKAGMACAHQSR